MSKKEILIIIITAIIVTILSFIITYSIINKDITLDNSTKTTSNKEVLEVGNYTLNYGIYKGKELDYNQDTYQIEEKEIILKLTKDKIISNNTEESYIVKVNEIYINNYPIYRVTANNKFILLAGEGVEFVYEE